MSDLAGGMRPSFGTVWSRLGAGNAFSTLAARLHVGGAVDRQSGERLLKLTSPRAAHPLWCRDEAGDWREFVRVFGDERYKCVQELKDVKTIVDAGAQVGFASAYLLSRFPDARLVALEPEAHSAAVLARNLAPYGERASARNAGLWCRKGRLAVACDPGASDSCKVTEKAGGEAEAVDIPGLLDTMGWEHIDLLKVDIHGAERTVFQSTAEKWLGSVRNIAVALTDDTTRQVFFETVEPWCREITECGDLTVCKLRRG